MKVLHLDCSVRNGSSLSKELSGLFVKRLNEKFADVSVAYLDISKNTPKHPTALFIEASHLPVTERTEEMKRELEESDALAAKLIHADVYVIGMPMYNFSVPSNFKAFIDNIVRPGLTFKTDKDGLEGLLLHKKVYVINTRGADFRREAMRGMDQLQPYIRTIFGFMGITDINFINVSPVQFAGTEARENAIAKAKRTITDSVNALGAN